MRNIFICTLLLISTSLWATLPPPPSNSGPSNDSDGTVVTDGSKPNLPATRIVSNSVRGARDAKQETSPVTSGSFFDGLSVGAHFSLTSFNDQNSPVNSKGHVEERALTLTGSLSESTTLTLGYSRIEYRYGKQSPAVTLLAHGFEAAVLHNLDDNYAIGAYAFFQDIDIRDIGDSYSAGGGVLFTTFHDFGFAKLSTSSTLTYVDYDSDDDFIFIGLVDVSRDINDWLTVGVNTSWTDAFTDNANNSDDNYWTVGADVRLRWDNFALSVGYDKTLKLTDYSDDTLNISLIYTF